MLDVYSITWAGYGEQRGRFETLAAAHARAVTLMDDSSIERTEILRGDELIWDSRNGFNEAA